MKTRQMLISIHLENMIKQTCILMKVKKIFLSFQEEEQWEDLLGNQNTNRKHGLEGEFKKEGSQILTSTVCTRSYLSIIA